MLSLLNISNIYRNLLRVLNFAINLSAPINFSGFLLQISCDVISGESGKKTNSGKGQDREMKESPKR